MAERPGDASAIRDAFTIFWRLATHYVRVRVVVSIGVVIAASVLSALSPLALKLTVDEVSSQHGAATRRALLLIGLYIIGLWTARVLGELRGYLYAQAERRLARTLSTSLYSHVLHLPFRFHLHRQTGALNETLTTGVTGSQMMLQTVAYTIIPVLLQLGTVAVVLSSVGQSTFIFLFLITLVCYVAIFTLGIVRNTRIARAAASAQIDTRALMTDGILNYETVKYFTAEPLMVERIDRALGHAESKWIEYVRGRALIGLGIATIFACFLATTLFYATSQVVHGRMTLGTFVLINTYLLQLVTPVEQIGYALQQVSQSFGLFERVLALFRERPEQFCLSDETEASRTCDIRGELKFENVSASYEPGRKVVQDVSFVLGRGKTLGIVGFSGAGKSTLVRLLVRLIEPDSGRIFLDGSPISELPLHTLRQSIAIVPQDTVLLNDTIAYNIAFGRPESSLSEIKRAARLAHLDDFVDALPDGYNTIVGERGVKLSGGEKQRISIARAALKGSRIYVFDEATSSLDAQTEREILRNLRNLATHSTTLIIAHRLSTVVHADEILVLENGFVVERGSHQKLLQLNGGYAALWRAQKDLEISLERS